jgi:hypothetical protein
MTIINTYYSTIEEAWGVDRIDRKKPVKKPICNLYENRNKTKTRPYRNNTTNELNYKETMFANNGNEDYDKYYGYADARAHSRTTKPLKNHKEYFKPEDKRRVAINPNTNTYMELDDDVYEESYSQDKNNVVEEEYENIYEETPYEEVYEENDDNYLTNMRTNATKNVNMNRYVDEEINEEIDEERYDITKAQKQYNNNPSHLRNDANKQILDLSLYTLSGVLVIFMMEQFVQMGMKIKSYN